MSPRHHGQTEERKLDSENKTRPLETFQFLNVYKKPQSKPESSWKTRGSGAEYDLEDRAVCGVLRGGRSMPFFNPSPSSLLQTAKPKPEAPQKARVTFGVGVLTRAPIQGGKGTELYHLLRYSTPTNRLNVICLESHVFNIIVTFWQLKKLAIRV